MSRRPAVVRALTAAVGTVLMSSLLVAPPSTASPGGAEIAAAGSGGKAVKVANRCIASAPEPGSRTPVKICFTIFKPAGASAKRKVPVLLEGHGWGGSRMTRAAQAKRWTDAGYGVVSIDQRGFGQSGGTSHVMHPAYEGKDLRRIVNHVAKLRWVLKDGRRDPRMGTIGGSYGGGYQFLTAFEFLRVRGKPVIDAMAPQITWHDLNRSIAPNRVVRTLWATVLVVAALPSNALPPKIYKALTEGLVTGQWPEGDLPLMENLRPFFERNGPSWHVRQGRRLDIPMLIGQGTTDGLFNLQEGLRNWRKALTKRARKQSVFVGYNGGHTLPALFPAGVNVVSDPCSKKLAGGSFDDLTLRFFDRVLKGRKQRVRGLGKVHIGTATGQCLTSPSGGKPTRTVKAPRITTPTAVGLPISVPIAKGPIRVAGSVRLDTTVTSLGLDGRTFLGLAVGRTPFDAKLVQNNTMPLRVVRPVSGLRRTVELPAVGVSVPKGQNLYLMATAIHDTSVLMGSRIPGALVLDNNRVHLPVVR